MRIFQRRRQEVIPLPARGTIVLGLRDADSDTVPLFDALKRQAPSEGFFLNKERSNRGGNGRVSDTLFVAVEASTQAQITAWAKELEYDTVTFTGVEVRDLSGPEN